MRFSELFLNLLVINASHPPKMTEQGDKHIKSA